ncbi:UNVERIFIED_CONTAM: DNA-binding transcriptional MerR regulator [Acetivibrio alkalicellulosi]
MYTIKELCEKSNLSRSTILYYHSIGLLHPEGRSETNYRLYSKDSIKRLERICTYREAGVPLKEISKVLCMGESVERVVLEKTLEMLNNEAKKVRARQEIIINMLEGEGNIMEEIKGINKDIIIEALKSIGVDDDGLDQLHAKLEEISPKAHQNFLEILGCSEEEIKIIRSRSSNLGL